MHTSYNKNVNMQCLSIYLYKMVYFQCELAVFAHTPYPHLIYFTKYSGFVHVIKTNIIFYAHFAF